MRPSAALDAHRDSVRVIVSRHRVRNPRVFGSVVSGLDLESSDLDLLVDTTEQTTLFDLCRIQDEVEGLLGVRVDVVTPGDLPPTMRSRILQEAIPL